MDTTTPQQPRSISESQAFARRVVYLWVWSVSRKLGTVDPQIILRVTKDSGIDLRLKDVRLALEIGAPTFAVPPPREIHTAMLGKGDRSAAIQQVITAAAGSEQLQLAVKHLLGEDTPGEENVVRMKTEQAGDATAKLDEIKPPAVEDPGPDFEEEIAKTIDTAVHLAGRHKEMYDPPDVLTNPDRPPSPARVLALLTIDLVHGYYRAKRQKDEMSKIRHANMIIKASATRFAIKRFSQIDGAAGEVGAQAGSGRALPPIEVASAG